ncbi:MAG: electron transport complex subunit RsxD [Methylophilaceae bacterium]
MSRSPYLTSAPSVSVIMIKVLLALLPAVAAYVWVFGPSILVMLTLASITALSAEALMLKLRNRPIKPFLMDGSALLTAWLLALSLPPLAPWWLVVVGTFFAIVIAKQLYGGLGYNPFNPAMVGYAVLLISFPVIMTHWPAPIELAQAKLSFANQLEYIFGASNSMNLDAVSMATPLDYLKTQLTLHHSVQDIVSAAQFGLLGAKGGELIVGAYLIGGLYLLQQRLITWHLPIAFLAVLALMAGAFYSADPTRFANPLFHLFTGASMLGAFFIITDPVSGPTTPKGKLVFAAGIAVLTYLIRVYGGYPDGVAFSVLLMNMCVPLIDAWTQPRVFGHQK